MRWLFNRFPWMLLVLAYLLVVEQLQLLMDGPVAYGFVALAFIAFFIEMFKGGDIGVAEFFWDQLWAIIVVALATGLLTYLYFVQGREPSFYHWVGYGVILADALLNAVNSYRTALRNFGVGPQA